MQLRQTGRNYVHSSQKAGICNLLAGTSDVLLLRKPHGVQRTYPVLALGLPLIG